MNHGANRSLAPEETPTWCFYLGLALPVRQARYSLAPGASQAKHPKPGPIKQKARFGGQPNTLYI